MRFCLIPCQTRPELFEVSMQSRAWSMALLTALAIGGCDQVVDGGTDAQRNADAGSARAVADPVAPGFTRKGASELGARTPAALRGIGVAGGLGGSSGLGMTGSFPPTALGGANAGIAPEGSRRGTRGVR
ncbi:MAG: hypothetical protein NVS3B2_07270 [Ramlibacter sp.]